MVAVTPYAKKVGEWAIVGDQVEKRAARTLRKHPLVSGGPEKPSFAELDKKCKKGDELACARAISRYRSLIPELCRKQGASLHTGRLCRQILIGNHQGYEGAEETTLGDIVCNDGTH